MSLSKEVELTHAQTPVPCDTCDDKTPGMFYCGDCKKTLCEDCEQLHKKFTKGHKLVLRALIGNVDASIITCTRHAKDASFHCDKCNRPVCCECVIGIHQGHKMVNLNTKFEEKKQMLQNTINEIKNVVVPNLERAEGEIQKHRENYKMKTEEVLKEMERENKSLHDELDRVHQKRRESLYSKQEQNLVMMTCEVAKVKQTLEISNEIVSKFEEALERNSLATIYNFTEREIIQLDLQSRGTPYLPQPPSFIPTDKNDFIRIMGKLHFNFLLKQ